MSRIGLSCLLVMSMSSVALTASTASARRLVAAPDVLPPPATAFAEPPPAVAIAPRHIEAQFVAPTRAQVRAALVKARAQNLVAFRAYYTGGSYPSNVYSKNTINVWRDEAGKFCAAATIMVKSGNEALAIQIGDDNNFIKLGDVKQGPVMDWIISSGFTQAELALIQKPFSPVTKRPTLDPDASVLVDLAMRKAENARLLALYKQIDEQLVSKQRANLERTVDRLMKKPELASKLVNASA